MAIVYQVRKPRTERHLRIRGVDYCVHEWGNSAAPLLIYLHGWADTGSTIQFVVDELANDWFVVAPDWRGFGKSACRTESYWFPDYLADLDVLLQHYSAGTAAKLVGHSMGANVASLYSGVMPERVSHLVNVEGFGLAESQPSAAPARYREWILAQQDGPQFSHYADFESLAKRIQKRSPTLSEDRATFVAREWAYQSDAGEIRLLADEKHKIPNPVLYRRREAEACWNAITAETLLISGDQPPFGQSVESLGRLPFPGAQRQVITGSGHMLHFEVPQALAAAIEAFLG